jgi:23S rRNA A1618 N6-methylase RlmF
MDVHIDNTNTGSSSRKRRHADSSTLTAPKTSLEILQLVEKPNFEELARHYPAFQTAWSETRQRQKESHGSFSSCITQEFTIALTRALLQAQFQLQLPYLESHHLCPPVPNRFFYVHWIHSSLLTMNERTGWGMDIGTGATCIYPLLATRCLDCNMLATDIDAQALSLAKRNVEANQMDDKIHLLQVPPSHSQDPSRRPPGGPLQRGLAAWGRPQQRFDFVMTNPPFYDPNDNSMEHVAPRAGDGRDRTAMTVSEGNYPGGEIGFVTELLADSLRARQSSKWFSSMLGKKTSFIKLQKLVVHMLGPAHVVATEYGPGQYTRWFLAWTLEQPLALAPLARIKHANDAFLVTAIEGISSAAAAAVAEVTSRIRAFCESSPGGWDLTMDTEIASTPSNHPVLVIKEAMPLAVTNFVDESMPNANIPELVLSALQGQDNSTLLPDEGHFVIRIHLQQATPNHNNNNEGNDVKVQLECYGHSSRGIKAIEKIRNNVEGEVCQTNRKWRRIRQRNGKQTPGA